MSNVSTHSKPGRATTAGVRAQLSASLIVALVDAFGGLSSTRSTRPAVSLLSCSAEPDTTVQRLRVTLTGARAGGLCVAMAFATATSDGNAALDTADPRFEWFPRHQLRSIRLVDGIWLVDVVDAQGGPFEVDREVAAALMSD